MGAWERGLQVWEPGNEASRYGSLGMRLTGMGAWE